MVSFILEIVTLTIFSTSILIGVFLEMTIIRQTKKVNKPDLVPEISILIRSFRGLVLLWSVILGTYFSLLYLKVNFSVFSNPELLFIIIALSVLIIISRVLSGFIQFYAVKTQTTTGLSIIDSIVKLTLFLLGMLLVLDTLGVKITPILTAFGIGGLAVALALQNTLSNLFAGLYLIATNDFRKGEYIRLDSGEEGYIVDINWRHTTIKTFSKNKIIIPNTKISNATISKFYINDRENVMIFTVGVGYESDLRKVEAITIDIARETINEIQEKYPIQPPIVRYTEFAPSTVEMKIVVYARNLGDRALIRHRLIQNIHEKFREEKIDIPYPTSVILSK